MKQIMINKLYNVYKDFKNDIYNRSNLCELKSFTFSSSNIPNYKNEVIQKFYLLRYMLGYFCEYYSIYDQLLRDNFLQNNLNICSIGCGCGLDFWGAEYAKERKNGHVNIKYRGIDKVDWLYKDKLGQSNVDFVVEDVTKSLSLHGNDYNVIIFPKSIGEFDQSGIMKILMIINKMKFTSDRLVLVSSIRNTRDDFDISKMKTIVGGISNVHHYNVLSNVDQYWYCKKKENGWDYRINEIIPGLYYPRNIDDDVSNMYKNCKVYTNNCNSCHNNSCMNALGRRPITTMSQAKYQIIKLERK